MEDWTVEGSTDSRIRPVQSGAVSRCGAMARAVSTEHGKHQEGRREDHDVQAPMPGAGERGARGEAGAVQEKQQRNGGIGEVSSNRRAGAVDRK